MIGGGPLVAEEAGNAAVLDIAQCDKHWPRGGGEAKFANNSTFRFTHPVQFQNALRAVCARRSLDSRSCKCQGKIAKQGSLASARIAEHHQAWVVAHDIADAEIAADRRVFRQL